MKKRVGKQIITKQSQPRKKVQKYKPQKKRLKFTNKKRIQKPIVNQSQSQNQKKLQNRKQPFSTLNNPPKKVAKHTKPPKRVIRATKQVIKKESLKKTRGQTQAQKESNNERLIFKTKQIKKRQTMVRKTSVRVKKSPRVSYQNTDSDQKTKSVQMSEFVQKIEEENVEEEKVQEIIQKEPILNYYPNEPLKSQTEIENEQKQQMKDQIKEKRQKERLELLMEKEIEKQKKQELKKKKQLEKDAFLEEARRNRGRPKFVPGQSIKRSKSQEKAIKKNKKNQKSIKNSDSISQSDQNIKPDTFQCRDESQENVMSQQAKISCEKQSVKSQENNEEVILEKIFTDESENSIKISQRDLIDEDQILQKQLKDHIEIQDQINGLKSYSQSELKNAFQDNKISNSSPKEVIDNQIINEQKVIPCQNNEVAIQQEKTKDNQNPVECDFS